jgi:hypothetical protein
MSALRCLLLLAVSACKAKEAPPPPLATIQVRDNVGVLVAELRPIRPCRGSIGPVELIVGGPPLIADYGSTHWTGSAGSNGTTLIRDKEAVARVFPVGDPTSAAVLDLHGVALARIAVTGKTAVVSDAASVPVRNLTATADAIKVDAPPMTITGTDDLILGALLSAPELSPEVRILSACERLLVKDQ